MILLVSFARERNVLPDTVTAYIRRHKEEFDGHTTRKGNKLLLDDEAILLLDEAYPLPKPIEIIEDTESRQKLIKAQELIIQLQAKLSQQEIVIAQAEAIKLLLEDKDNELEYTRNQLKEAQEHIERIEADKEAIQGKYEAEINKSWWDKLRGK